MISVWYATKAARRRGVYRAERVGKYLYLHRKFRDGGNAIVVMIWGRTPHYIDRLVRDWLGHGVAPCKDGSRGVADRSTFELHSGIYQHCDKHTGGQWNSFCDRCVMDERWRKGERAAMRVVSRG